MASLWKRSAAPLLAGVLGSAGVMHFATPKPFARIVPKVLPAPECLVAATGVAELALAAGVLVPKTRKLAAYSAAAFFAGVFPANVQMALDAKRAPTWYKAGSYARLPLQAPLIGWALSVARNAD
jgi:uncharacterized membrane protein